MFAAATTGQAGGWERGRRGSSCNQTPWRTPVWLSTSGPTATLNRMVLAQDTGNAIRGAVRADYFAGWSPEAATLAHAMKQPLRLWVLWPR